MQRGKVNKKIKVLGTKQVLSARKIKNNVLSTRFVDTHQNVPDDPVNPVLDVEQFHVPVIYEEFQAPINNTPIWPIFCLPTPSDNTICFTNALDTQQAYCVFSSEKQKSLVVISKKRFWNENAEDEGVITGCSTCGDVMNTFMIFFGKSNCSINEKPNILKCFHIKTAISTLLYNNGVWKSTFPEDELETTILQNLRDINETDVFYNENHSDYCGAIIENYGLFLFVFKHQKWRCVSCGERDISKCKHGQIINLPFTDEFYDSCERALPIGHSENHIIGSSIIEGKNSL